MPINSDKPHLWKADVALSIDFYNDWFLRFAPVTYREQRVIRTKQVLNAFDKTTNLCEMTPQILAENPGILSILRMVTAPPLARDRLIGLAHLNKAMVEAMEGKDDKPPRLPSRMKKTDLAEGLERICDIVAELADRDLLPWLDSGEKPPTVDVARAATVIADRVCGAASDPIIRNAQEKRQLTALKRWLRRHEYREIKTDDARNLERMPPGTFTFHLSIPAGKKNASVNIPIDCVVKPIDSDLGDLPIMVEAKSAGDATNTNKRRKEEAQKYAQLKERYGKDVVFVLLLCGYFEPGYLGYEAAEGIDWVWEHRLDDVANLLIPPKRRTGSVVREARVEYSASDASKHEEIRFGLQRQVDESKLQEERNRLGQFSTPFPLARQIVARAVRELPATAAISFLEPALGSGVFFSALIEEAEKNRIREAVGVELDEAYARIASRLFSDKGLAVVTRDFLLFARDCENHGRFNLLCTNPPYVRHHHMPSSLKQELQSFAQAQLGLKISGLTGLYVYFVLLADALLAENGVASWLLPAEFLYVNYGQPLRDYLSNQVELITIHHFDAETVQFDDALVSSCIVTYRKKRPSAMASFAFSSGSSVTDPQDVRTIDLGARQSAGKWTLLNFDHREPANGHDYVLGDFFDVRRGIATGANNFFIINSHTAEEFSIPRRFLKPILPSPRFMTQEVIEANPDGSPHTPTDHLLLDCHLPPDVVRDQFSGLWRYLQLGVQRKIDKRYLCANKDIWYSQEKRLPSLYLATYMGRSNGSTKSPIRFLLNLSQAITTNVYLHLYPKPALQRLLGQDAGRMKELLNLLNGIPVQELLRAGRAYGGGLHKVEPGEIRNLVLDHVPQWMTSSVTKQMVLI